MGSAVSTINGGASCNVYRYGVEASEHSASDVSVQPMKRIPAWIGKTLDRPSAKGFVLLAHFQLRGLLGTGMLGHVHLVQHLKSKKYFALKSMVKEDIVARDMLRHVECERDALQKLDALRHPFLVRYFGSYQMPRHVHLVLEYVPGGELLHRLHAVGRFTPDEAKFYATELVMFIEFIHSQNYMYRDLKPENVLLDAEGHIKVVDLGFVRGFENLRERCMTDVGTPQYLAPEQLTQSKQHRGYTSVVDWWALACMIYEMVTGKTPFDSGGNNTSPFELYTRIMQGRIHWPRNLPAALKALLKGMLTTDPISRLCDANGVKQHPWFANVDWFDVIQCEIQPPYRPTLQVEGDRSSFDAGPDGTDASKNKITSDVGPTTYAHEFRRF